MSNSAITFNTAGLASTTSPGLVGTGAQTFAGKKTFQNGAAIAGDISGVAIDSNNIGYTISNALAADYTETGTIAVVISITVPVGCWLISLAGSSNLASTYSAAPNTGYLYGDIYNGSVQIFGSMIINDHTNFGTTFTGSVVSTAGISMVVPYVNNSGSNQTISFRSAFANNGRNVSGKILTSTRLSAIRIA